VGCGVFARGGGGAGLAVTTALAVLWLVAPAAPASAQQTEEGVYSHGRYYFGLSGITAFRTGGYEDQAEPSWGVAANAGYRLLSHLGTDVQGEWHSNFDRHGGGHYTAWAVTGIARGYLLTGRIQPYALLGAGVIQTRKLGQGSTTTQTGFAPRAGMGVSYFVTRDLALTLDAAYVVPVGDPKALDFVSINWGLQWY